MKKLFVVLALVVVWCGGAFAQQIDLPDAKSSGIAIVSEKTDGKGLSMRMSCGIDKLFFHDAETPRGGFSVLYSPKFSFDGAFGAPQLPVIQKLIQVPFGADFKVEVTTYDSKVVNLADHGISRPLFPRQPSAPKDGSEVPFVYEKSAYIYKGFHGRQLVSIEEAGVMRHMRLVRLTISPITYNPVENKLMVCNNVDFKVVLTGGDMAKTRAKSDTYWSPAFAWMDSVITVPEALRFPKKKNAQQVYLIVSDPAFKKEIAPFADWKAQKGFKVKVVYTDQFGTGVAIRDGLKTYLHGLYNNPTSDLPAPSYVLFVGDNDNLPAFAGQTGSHITDIYYSAVTPGDLLPEMLTGRFSAQNAQQLQPQIDKTMQYEKREFADPSFLNDTLLVAGWDSGWAKSHGWPHINYATKYYFNKENGFKNVSAYLSAGSQQNVAAIVAAVAKGVGYVNYTAHGSQSSWADPSFTIANIEKLGNKGKYPLVVGNCCLTSKFEVPTCFGEAWLRTKDGGAIGYIGGSNSTYWDEDIWWGIGLHAIVKPNEAGVPPAKETTGRGAIDSLFDQANGISNAAFMVVGNLAVESSSSTRKQYYWEVYHLMGDPALVTLMGQPKP